MSFIDTFFFDIYPYIAATIFFVGSWLRYDYSQYSWRAGSSQLLSNKNRVWASNCFHIGIIGILFGHLFGLLTPHWVYEPFISTSQKQMLAIVMGGLCGLLTLGGGAALLYRRVTDPRLRATSTKADILVIALLVIQAFLGLLTITLSLSHLDGGMMLDLVHWAQSIVTFQFGASLYLQSVPFLFKLHLVLGMTLFVIFPFSRLVHIWSAPVEYITRRYQIVRQRVKS